MNFNKQKRAIVEALLPLCPFMGVDGSQPGVMLPDDLRVARLVLRIGVTPRVLDIPGLVFTDEHWSGVISQHGKLSTIIIPWTAVERCWVGDPFEGPVVMWPEAAQVPATSTPVRRLSVVPALRVVDDTKSEPEPPRSA